MLTSLKSTVVLAAAVALTGSTLAAAHADPTQARRGPCAGVKRCHQVARIDVDGDRRADRVGWRQLSNRRVQIRVRTADGELLKRRIGVRYWPGGGAWGDAAWIDGRRGAELLIGAELGAHTPHYRMLTYRRGRLVGEPSPWHGSKAHMRRWAVDGAYSAYSGWHRNVGPRGGVSITRKYATRRPNGTYKGFNVRYAWRRGDWRRVNRAPRRYRNQRQARKIGGWHVGHLKRWPSL